jgi:hypothetical protein
VQALDLLGGSAACARHDRGSSRKFPWTQSARSCDELAGSHVPVLKNWKMQESFAELFERMVRDKTTFRKAHRPGGAVQIIGAQKPTAVTGDADQAAKPDQNAE